jgi:hypothetical protein
VASTWLPVRRAPPIAHITTARCPRKGPLLPEISLLICAQLNEAHPERCEACNCTQALAFAKQIEELKGTTRGTMRVFREPLPASDEDGEVEGGEVV